MKRNRHQVEGERDVIPAYEKQRMENLKKNAEFMQSKGYGTLANKILKDKAEHFSKHALDEVPHQTKMKQMQAENAPVKSGTMAKILTNRPHKQQDECVKEPMHKDQTQLDDVTSKRMAEFLTKQEFVKQWVQQGGTLESYESQARQGMVPKSGSMAKFLSTQASMQVVGHSAPSSSCAQQKSYENQAQQVMVPKSGSTAKFLSTQASMQVAGQFAPSESSAQQQQQVEKPYVQPEKKKQQQKVCPPGALSKYLDKRKKEAQNANGAGLKENGNALENEAQSGLQSSQSMKEVELEKEVQPDLDVGDNVPPVAHQPECTPTMEATNKATETKKRRGPTKLLEAHARTLDERPPIVLNSKGQPVGPSQKLVGEYTRFLGTVARDPNMAPLDYCDWSELPTHDKMWNYVQEKYLIPNEGRKWSMQTMDVAWRRFKHKTKNEVVRENKRPKTVPENQLKILEEYWNDPKVQEQSKKNKANRECLNDMHTMGSRSFATLRHELQQKDPNKQEPSQAKVYKESRKRNPIKAYKTSSSISQANMEKMDALETQQSQGGEANIKDPYYEVIQKPEHSGRVRLFGKGVTKSSLKEKGSTTNKYIIPQEFLQSIQMQVVENIREANPGLHIVMPNEPSSQVEESNGGQRLVGVPSPNDREANLSGEVDINPKEQWIVQQNNNPEKQMEALSTQLCGNKATLYGSLL